MKKNYPNVVIVGRTNVGKSTLFNRLTKTKQSLVFEREGVTRDYISKLVSWNDKTFNMIDTGGLPLTKQTDEILKEVEKSVFSLIEQADLVLFVCDGKNGLVEKDRTFAKLLHKSKKPTILLLNKSDNIRAFEEHEYEFYALGFDKVLHTSAVHGTGISELLDEITENLEFLPTKPEEEDLTDLSYRITILGKPNVGKSSLLNLLLRKERAIVSEVAGTTREDISEIIKFHKEMVQITDTPGVRRKGKVSDELEQEMVKRSFQSVRQADIVLMMIDSTQGHLADQELKLLFYAYEQKKSIILLMNKTDILEPEKKDRLEYDMKLYEFIIKKIPMVWISCKTEKNIGNVLSQIQKAQIRRNQEFDQVEVNELIKQAFIRKPMYHKRQLLKVLNVKPIKTQKSVPTFILYVNFPEWFGPTQLGFIENQLRRNYDLLGCPIEFILQKV